SGAAVFYAAPHFDTPAELNDAYINSTVVQRSVFFRPSEIGVLPDDDAHHITFKNGAPAFRCSVDPLKIRDDGTEQSSFKKVLYEGVMRYQRLSPSLESVVDWN